MFEQKKNTGFAFACWILVALILIIFFLVKKDAIVTNLRKTDFFERMFGSTPEFVKKHGESSAQPEKTVADEITIDLLPNPEPLPPDQGSAEKTAEAAQDKTAVPAEPPRQEKEKPAESGAAEVRNPEKKPAPKVPAVQQNMTMELCFVVIDSDGSVSRKIVKRTVPKNDSPLTSAVRALLEGPSAAEAGKNCTSLIPQGTRLLGASVKNGVATLNFSEEFEFNPLGVEGSIGQLMQITYTATEFSTVSSVQFLIEGEKKEYLGSEGQWIGSPLARSSFK